MSNTMRSSLWEHIRILYACLLKKSVIFLEATFIFILFCFFHLCTLQPRTGFNGVHAQQCRIFIVTITFGSFFKCSARNNARERKALPCVLYPYSATVALNLEFDTLRLHPNCTVTTLFLKRVSK